MDLVELNCSNCNKLIYIKHDRLREKNFAPSVVYLRIIQKMISIDDLISKKMEGKGMKYINALYIAVVLFVVMGISAMAYPENKIGIVHNAITILQTSILSVGSSKLDTSNNIPEFPKVALPMAAVIGLVFLFQIKRQKR